VLLLALLAPLLLTDVPPLLDYPNHLARAHVIANVDSDPALARFYRVEWQLIPNLAFDLIVVPLTGVMSLYAAGRFAVALAILLPVLGTIALHTTVFRRRSWWPLATALVGYNGLLLGGFVSFLIGTGLALLAAAVWIGLEHRHVGRALVSCIFVSVLFASHLLGLALFLGIVTVWELAHAISNPERARIFSLLPSLITAVFLYANSPAVQDPNMAAPLLESMSYALRAPEYKLRAIIGPFLLYQPWLDILALLLFVGTLSVARFTQQLAHSRALGAFGCAMAIFLPLAPDTVADTGWIDRRLALWAVLMLFAATDLRLKTRSVGQLLAASWAALFTARLALLGAAWMQHNNDLTELRAAIAPVPAGARVMAVRPDRYVTRERHPNRWLYIFEDATLHWPALLVIERSAYWPGLFSARGKQPIVLNRELRYFEAMQQQPPRFGSLEEAGRRDHKEAAFLEHWERKVDYVLLLQADNVPTAASPRTGTLEPVVITPAAALYRVRRMQ
jgi:hypothetical protein